MKIKVANPTKRRKRKVMKKKPVRRRRRVKTIAVPNRRYRRVKRNPSLKGFGDVLINGGLAGAGAAIAILITNLVSKFFKGSQGAEMSGPSKNLLLLGVSAALAFGLPKLKVAGKYTETITTGALAIAVVNMAKTSLGLDSMLTLSGADNTAIDRIIDSIDVSGWDEQGLLGMRESANTGFGGLLDGVTFEGDNVEDYY